MIKAGGPAFLDKKLIWPVIGKEGPNIPKIWLLTLFQKKNSVIYNSFLYELYISGKTLVRKLQSDVWPVN